MFMYMNIFLWGVITSKIKFGILLCCLPMQLFSLVMMSWIVFKVFSISFTESSFPLTAVAKRELCAIDADCAVKPDGQNSIMSFVISEWSTAGRGGRRLWERDWGVLSYIRQINVAVVVLFLYFIIRAKLSLCRSVWCYAKLWFYFNYALLNPGFQIAWLLWSGTSDKLIMHVLLVQRKFILLSMEDVVRKSSLIMDKRDFTTTCLAKLRFQ